MIEKISNALGLERLTVRQIIDTTQRPKVDDYDEYIYFSVKSILKNDDQLNIEQLSFVLGKNFVVSFQEEVSDHFNHLRYKMRENLGSIWKRGCDFIYKKDVDKIKKSLSPFKEALTNILKDRTHFISKSNRKYYRDLKKQLHQCYRGS